MVRSGDFAGLRDALVDFYPPDLAELIDELPPEDGAVIFRILPRQLAGETFAYLDREIQDELVKAMGDARAARLLEAMPPDDRTAYLEELPAEVTRRLLEQFSPAERRIANQLLGYPEDSVGRRMTTDYIAIREEWTVDEVLEHVRKYGRDSETLNVLYVVDQTNHLIGALRVREILLAQRNRTVESLIGNADVLSLRAAEDQESAVNAFRKYDVVALPVTDTDGVLVGILTVDDVLDVAEQEATEDIQKLGGMEALEEPYMQISFRGMFRKRAPWLVLLFIGEMGATAAMANYEHAIAQVAALSAFVPLIMSCGGNSGSQAGTLVIRAMALGEIRLADWFRVCRREMITGLAFGAALGIIGFLMVYFWNLFSGGNKFGDHWVQLALTLGCSVMGVVLWGTVTGCSLPFILRRLGLDPATSSAPFVATLIDVTGLLIFFNIAMFWLRGTLL